MKDSPVCIIYDHVARAAVSLALEIYMSTPAMAFGVGLRNVVVSFWLVWTVTFCISRVFLLHEAYIAESSKRIDERWLLEKCREPEFYSNIRQHTDLCTEVANNARGSLLLSALNSVAARTHACGSTPCLELVYSAVARLGWQASLSSHCKQFNWGSTTVFHLLCDHGRMEIRGGVGHLGSDFLTVFFYQIACFLIARRPGFH